MALPPLTLPPLTFPPLTFPLFRRATPVLAALCFLTVLAGSAAAHPLGNFTINHYTRIEISDGGLRLRYVVDMAEIPTFQELQKMGRAGAQKPSPADLSAYARRAGVEYARNISLTVDGVPVALTPLSASAVTKPGAGGLPILDIMCDLAAGSTPGGAGAVHRLRFTDGNSSDRIGWREVVVKPARGYSVFNSSAYGSAVTDELKAYPQDMIAAPLSEQTAALSWSQGPAPAGATALRTREGRAVVPSARDRFTELIAVKTITPIVALLGALFAFLWGAGHAFSPGHGKAVVGAYLIGSRGTARHAAFLGLTVTITHTLGVFALGLITLFASRCVLPDRLFPILTFVSGALVAGIGLSLFVQRLRAMLGVPDHAHGHDHPHGHSHEHSHSHDAPGMHSHGGGMHSHLPPGADGAPVTWRSLLALGISGGLLPCPSALLVLLSAVALHRVAYGLVLVVAFSIGLAATLTGIGVAFIHAGRLLERARPGLSSHPLTRALPIFSAFVITCVGAALCWQVVGPVFAPAIAAARAGQVGADGGPAFGSLSALAVLGLGLVFGLKHATEVDHVVAVSTIVSEHKNLWRSTLVGGLWGVGHTLSLVIVGVIVLALRVAIPAHVASWLEFGVALMIITLGALALARALRGRAEAHRRPHDGEIRPGAPQAGASHSHAALGVGLKPLVVGAIHGLAGSGALTLLVLTQIPSVFVGLLYLAVFGLGSILGMLLMSGLVGLPFAVSARRFTGINAKLQAAASVLSLAFGFWYAYQTGIANGLLKSLL